MKHPKRKINRPFFSPKILQMLEEEYDEGEVQNKLIKKKPKKNQIIVKKRKQPPLEIKQEQNIHSLEDDEKKDKEEEENIDQYMIRYKLQNQEKYKKLESMINEPIILIAETAKCKHCQKYTLITMEQQARSADEKQDVFATCSNEECNQKRTQKL